MISEILSQPPIFPFSIAGDGSTHYESSYFDIHIQMGINGVLHNLHLMIVLFYGHHIVINILALIVKILDVLFPMWCDRLISMNSDGENTMTNRHGGFMTLLEKEATNNIVTTLLLEEWEDDFHTPEMGTWESVGTPKTSKFDC
jgi:hypothetical protein